MRSLTIFSVSVFAVLSEVFRASLADSLGREWSLSGAGGLTHLELRKERVLIIAIGCLLVVLAELLYASWDKWIDARHFRTVRWVVFAGYLSGIAITAALLFPKYAVMRQIPVAVIFLLIYVMQIISHTEWPWAKYPPEDLFDTPMRGD